MASLSIKTHCSSRLLAFKVPERQSKETYFHPRKKTKEKIYISQLGALTNMKMIKFWFLFLVAEAACMILIVNASSSTHDMDSFISGKSVTASTSVSQPKQGRNTRRRINQDYMNLEDYQPVDPTPGSSATTTSGPIEHGSPIIPYIPKLTPPNSPQQPDHGSPSPPPPA